jgi:diadenosine tetraphosphate (Ap4A) HIT family hydrolase
MGRTVECSLCDLVVDLDSRSELIDINDHWYFNIFQGESIRPRWVIQSKRHVQRFEELNSPERSALGDAIALATSCIEQEPKVEKVYLQSFNETPPGHLHVHLVPRFDFDQGLGSELGQMVKPLPELEQSVMDGVRQTLPERTTLPFVARASLTLTRSWGRWFSIYRLLSKLGRRFGPFDAAELYVVSWFWFLTALLVLQMTLPLHQVALVAISVIAAYRLLDIGTYVFGMLLDNKNTRLVGLSRSLILMLTNLLESSIATALILNSLNGTSWKQVGNGFAPMLGFELDTIGWTAFSYGGFIAGSAVFFICAILALAIVVGKIGERFSSSN